MNFSFCANFPFKKCMIALTCPFLDFCPPSHHQQSSTDWQWLFWWMAGGPAHTAATCSDNKSPFNQLASITFTFITHHQQHVQTTKTHVILSLSQFEERYWMGNVTSYHVLVLTYFAKPSSDLWQSSEVGIEEFPGEKTASCTSSSLAAKSLMTANIWRFIYRYFVVPILAGNSASPYSVLLHPQT